MAFTLEQRRTLSLDKKTTERIAGTMKGLAVDILGETTFVSFQDHTKRRALATSILAQGVGGSFAVSMTNILAFQWDNIANEWGTDAVVQRAWEPAKDYTAKTSKVAYGGFVREANQAFTSGEGFDPSKWDITATDVVRGVSDDEIKAGVLAFWNIVAGV